MDSGAVTGRSSYDLFLSYNSADHGVVENVARKLRDEGLEPFLDRWNLVPGMRWRLELEKTLGSCKAVAIFVGRGEMGSWQQREVDVALDLQSRKPSLPVIPVLLPGCEPPLGFLSQLTWVDLRTQTNGLGIAILAKAARGQAPGADSQQHFDDVRVSICPYRGLLHFREEDAPFFFGRETAIDKLVDAVQRQPFVAVVGASGSGKSSVVRAGLVPRVRSDRRTAWETVILVPTAEPLKALAKALVPLLEPSMSEVDRLRESGKLANSFKSGEVSLYDIVERILEKQSGTDRVLIVVDQFEELYTLTSDEESRRRFLDELLAASSRAGAKANIALTLRGDFVGKALAYRPLSDRLQDAQINLGPMTREELECAIRKPAEKIQLEFEPGLIRRILNDVGAEPGNLPLLEFVLKELWDKRCGRVLLNESYDAVGGLQGAVATKADELLNGLSPAEQKILQRVFLRIVRPSESGLDTRRRASFAELPPEGAEIVVKLANERLLVTNQSASGLEQTVEVAHEALISNWSTLRAWVNEDREFLLWRERLGTLRTEWERAQESEEALLRGPQLTEAQRWLNQRSQDLADQEWKFISASRALRERLEREEMDRQAQAAEEQRRAEKQRVAATRQRLIARILAAGMLIAAFLGFWAVQAQRKARDAQKTAVLAQRHAEDARMRASARQLAGQAFRKRDDELDLALLLALESRAIAEKLQGTELEKSVAVTDATSSVLRALLSPPGLQRLMHGHAQAVQSVAVSADGKMLASGDRDGVVRLWAADGKTPSRKLESKFDAVYSVAFSPDGRILAACGDLNGAPDKAIMLWRVATAASFGEPLLTRGRQVAFSPDGKYLATPSVDKVILWSMPDPVPGQRIELPTNDTAPVNRIAFNSNLENPILAAGGKDRVIRLWNIATESVQAELPLPASEDAEQLYSLAFNPQGNRLASGWLDKKIVVWDLDYPDASATLIGHFSPVFALAFGSDGITLVSGGTDRTIQRWDLSATPKKLEPLSGYAQEIYSLAANKNNEIFAGTGKGTIAVWNLAAKCPRLAERIKLPLSENEVVLCVRLLGEHGQTLAFGGSSGTIFLWDLAKGELLGTLVRHKKPVLCLASSSDGKNWASGSEEGIIFWNGAEPRGEVHTEKGAISALAFRPDGQLLASNTPGAEIVFWDVAGQTPDGSALAGHAQHVTSLAFSPDGKQLAAGDMAEKVLLWDATARTQLSSKPLCEFDNPTFSPVLSVAFSSKWQVATAGRDTIMLCNTNPSGSSLPVPRLEQHKAEVTSLAFSPNGQMLASASQDGTLILWDVPSAQFVYSLLDGSAEGENYKPISAVAFNLDGSRLVSAGSEVLVWDLSLEGWRTRACAIAGRNFTEEEWARYMPDEKYRPTFRRAQLMEAH